MKWNKLWQIAMLKQRYKTKIYSYSTVCISRIYAIRFRTENKDNNVFLIFSYTCVAIQPRQAQNNQRVYSHRVWQEHCKSTSGAAPPSNPLWLIWWLSGSNDRPAARKQSMQLTVAARATRETSRWGDASVATAAAGGIARAHRRSAGSNWENTQAEVQRVADTSATVGHGEG